MKTALLVIDIQNEYSQDGKLPVENFNNIVSGVNQLDLSAYDLTISIRHINQEGDIFVKNGVEYPSNLKLNYDVEVIKTYASSFDATNLQEILVENNIDNLVLCGMMTQNCITYTALDAISLSYRVSVIENLTGTINPMVHAIAIKALSSKVTIC